ncbi:MAG: hypothetical protein IJE28_01525 [Oscillospiraceae bacterium]|nr:hypothetical protein [Oscillospiraceae bacterium]MBQ3499814.1 hypothetical protein [Oscillospiraceae bacterium]MBQ4643587.1 hypothetical protein [Oscillospiraceae bacterium]
MGNLFSNLVSENLLLEWGNVLDWIFDDSKFSDEHNWNSGYVGQFTKKVKTLKGLSEENFLYQKIQPKDFPNQKDKKAKKQNGNPPVVMMQNGNSAARDLVRHIRNGIAHGRTKTYKVADKICIEITDFSDKTLKPEKQTAYIRIPISYITEMYKIYDEIEKSIRNTKEKDRKATKKYKKEM